MYLLFLPFSRYYVIRYSPVSEDTNSLEAELHYSYRNATDLNVMIDDLRPATEYEFAVKIVRGRRQSPWSLGIILHKMAIITIFGHKHLKLKIFLKI